MQPSPSAEARPRRTQIPSIGRMVIYNGQGHPQPEQSPAVIRSVNQDGTLDLTSFGPKGCAPINGVAQGDLVGQWNWPLDVRQAPPVEAAPQPID